MTQTEHYNLPQWEARDPLRRADFNGAMAAIEEGLGAAGALPYAVGSYTGNGATQTIELGFRPRFVVITGQEIGSSTSTALVGYIAFSGGPQISSVLTFEENGFTVTITAQICPMINNNGRIFSYLAFR